MDDQSQTLYVMQQAEGGPTLIALHVRAVDDHIECLDTRIVARDLECLPRNRDASPERVEWIRTSDRLPSNDAQAMYWIVRPLDGGGREVATGYYYRDCWWEDWYDDHEPIAPVNTPTHWMPYATPDLPDD